jgi:integrase
MNLAEAVEFTKQHRDSWNTGKGAKTAAINANHCIRILGGDVEVEGIRTQHFTQLARQLKKEGKAAGTINRITAALSTILSELKDNGYDLPDVHYKRQREPKAPRPGFFTEEEMDKLLEVAKGWKDNMLMHDALLVSVKTGCRQGELLKLKDNCVDFDNSTLTFVDTKSGTDHVIHMHKDVVDVMERRMHFQIDPFLFPFPNKDNLLREFKKLKAEAGLPQDDRVWHSIRHTTGTWLVERNVPLRAVMGVLNHSRVETTLRYAKASDRSIANAIDLL